MNHLYYKQYEKIVSNKKSPVYIDRKQNNFHIEKVLLQNHYHAVFIQDSKGAVIGFNHQLVDLLEFTPDEIFSSFLDYNDEHVRMQINYYMKKAIKGMEQTFKTFLKKKNGTTVNVEIQYIPLKIDYNGYYILATVNRLLQPLGIFHSPSHLPKISHFSFLEFDLKENQFIFSKDVDRIFGIDLIDSKLKMDYSIFLQYIHINDRSKFEKLYENFVQKGKSFDCKLRVVRKDQSIKIVYIKGEPLPIGKPTKMTGMIVDLTDQMEVNSQLNEMVERLTSIMDKMDVCIWSFDVENNQIVYCSEGVRQIYGVEVEFFLNEPLYWKICIYPNDLEKVELNHETIMKGKPIIHEYRMIRNGEIIWVKDQTIPTLNDHGEIIRLDRIIMDISKLKQYEERFDRIAYYDVMTSLPNGYRLSQDLPKWIKEADENGESFAVFFFNIDRLKKINHTLGRTIGDEVIKKIANRMRKIIPNEAQIYRIGGDEFVLLVKKGFNESSYIKLAEDLLEIVQKPLNILHHKLYFTTSIGICFYPTEGVTADSLLQCSHAALERAKLLGKNNYQLFTASIDIMSYKDYCLERDLRKALKNNELYIEYQPRINAKTKEIVGAEALLRWKHPEWGEVSPAEFIPIAEEEEVIIELSNWVIDQVCTQIWRWLKKGFQFESISINVSPKRLLKKGFDDYLYQTIKKLNIPPSLIEIELTETALLQTEDYVYEQIHRVKQLGIQLALDDFGTGYSSIHQLKRLPIDVLKIDKSFILNLEDPDNQVITKTMIELAKGLGIKVVAEGVETKKHLSFLEKYQCDEIQGFLFSPSVSPHRIEELFINKKVLPKIAEWNPSNERRMVFRFELPQPLLSAITIISIKGKQMKLGKTNVVVLNFGGGGLCFISHLRLPNHEQIIYQMESSILSRVIKVKGKVIWGKEIKPNIFKYGFQFIFTDSEKEEFIKCAQDIQGFLTNNCIKEEKNFIQEDPTDYIEKRFGMNN